MDELFISADIESTGPVPGLYSMYQLGACVVGDDAKRFYAELALISDGHVPEALSACGTSMPELRAKGDDPAAVMRRFAEWTATVAAGRKPVLVAFAATFDWMFIEWYLQRFVGASPFGHAGLDVKAYYMGLTRCRWDETSLRKIDPRFQSDKPHTHNALDDAIQQADMFAKMLTHAGLRP